MTEQGQPHPQARLVELGQIIKNAKGRNVETAVAEATQLFDTILRDNPTDTALQIKFASMYLDAQMPNECIRVCTSVIKSKQEDVDHHEHIAFALALLGDAHRLRNDLPDSIKAYRGATKEWIALHDIQKTKLLTSPDNQHLVDRIDQLTREVQELQVHKERVGKLEAELKESAKQNKEKLLAEVELRLKAENKVREKETKLQLANTRCEELSGQLENGLLQIEELAGENDKVKSDLISARSSMEDESQSEVIRELTKQVTEQQGELARIQNRLSLTTQQKEEIEAQLRQGADAKSIEASLRDSETERNALRAEVERLRQFESEAANQRRSLENIVTQLREQLSATEQKIAKDLSTVTQERDLLREENEILRHEVRDFAGRIPQPSTDRSVDSRSTTSTTVSPSKRYLQPTKAFTKYTETRAPQRVRATKHSSRIVPEDRHNSED
eukprot:c25624_g1_i1.p1 GENE.c25624_g1_i1~~c25624_g1_i1.p1  ORF type:complete len:445 (+),score=107.02 c25624_g1_i1:1-1335(+)